MSMPELSDWPNMLRSRPKVEPVILCKHTQSWMSRNRPECISCTLLMLMVFVPERGLGRCLPSCRCKCRRLLLGRLPAGHRWLHLHTYRSLHYHWPINFTPTLIQQELLSRHWSIYAVLSAQVFESCIESLRLVRVMKVYSVYAAQKDP